MYGVKSNSCEGQQQCEHCQRGFLSISLKTARAFRTHPLRVHEKFQVFLVRSRLVLNIITHQSDPLGKTFALIVLRCGSHLCSQTTCPVLSHLGYDSPFLFQEQTSQLQSGDPSQVSLEGITGPGTCRSIDPSKIGATKSLSLISCQVLEFPTCPPRNFTKMYGNISEAQVLFKSRDLLKVFLVQTIALLGLAAL